MNQTRVFFVFVLLVSVVSIMFFLGGNYYSKGEPREAIVAVSMLQDGNWVLPQNNGGDLAYKPPFFHWCIALFSLPQGHVSEATSRLPSAVALVLLVLSTFVFARRRSDNVALLASLLTLTAFEVHRAGMNCRVDMVLTALIVGAMFLLYRWYERDLRGLPWWAILCMSLATLTKGPVGIILPVFVMGLFLLYRRTHFWRIVWKLALCTLLSLLIPIAWYVAAYQQGGDAFLSLVYEENLGRMLGKMSYDSHLHPFTYNFLTLLTGWLPWMLLFLFALFTIRFERVKDWKAILRDADAFQSFTWIAFVAVLFFYCLPSSKRSVYLLPCYPFMAILLAEWMIFLCKKRRLLPYKIFLGFLVAIALLVPLAMVAVRCGWIPQTIFSGKHAAQNQSLLLWLQTAELTVWQIGLIALSLLVAVAGLCVLIGKRWNGSAKWLVSAIFVLVLFLYFLFDGVLKPLVLSQKSDVPLAEAIEKRFDSDETICGFIDDDYLRFYATNFYLGDRIVPLQQSDAQTGVLMVAERDLEALRSKFQIELTPIARTSRPMTERKDVIRFYRFKR